MNLKNTQIWPKRRILLCVLMEKIEARYGDKDGAEPPAKRQRGDSDAPHPTTIPTVPRTPMPSARCVVS